MYTVKRGNQTRRFGLDSPAMDRFRFWHTRAHGGKSPERGTDGSQPVNAHHTRDPSIPCHLPPNSKSEPDFHHSTAEQHNHHAISGRHNAAHGTGKSSDTIHGSLSTGAHGQLGQASAQAASTRAILNDPNANEKGPEPDDIINSGTEITTKDEATVDKPTIFVRLGRTTKKILFHSKINLLLVFVPVGIVVAQFSDTLSPGLIFAMNAIAIIPLAGLLSHATESVARKLGDTIGALLNVTFGNAVELIIFIALAKNEIRIVQASLLGSVLANLLLILGMAFLLGGLRFREQIYNSTVTQMSACLLSLSVSSLVLPTAFHWSFKDTALADAQSLRISRGTSVILLLVYVVYLLFQLKSHAYMYESTPQHIIDAEATPGPGANWLDSSSSDDDSSSSSDSDDSRHSRDTMSRRFRSALYVGRRRKSSIVSNDTTEVPTRTRTSSFGTTDGTPINDEGSFQEAMTRPFAPILSPTNTLTPDGNNHDDDAVDDAHSYHFRPPKRRRHRRPSFRRHHRRKKSDKASSHTVTDSRDFIPGEEPIAETPEVTTTREKLAAGEPRRIDFAVTDVAEGSSSAMNPTGKRAPFSVRPIFRSMAPSVFMQPMDPESGMASGPTGPVPAVRIGLRRVKSLPDRLNAQYNQTAMKPSQIPLATLSGPAAAAAAKSTAEQVHDDLSQLSSIILLLVSTGLVAACANFMVDSIQGLVESTSIGEVFIGLIILPIVGNAAEHVTAITVAMKNKMDLAIGVAVGSSIQIALFITPLVVILGWIMERNMSLYFTLFETVCLFVSAFIVNFLVLDGRSNYLEGALLCATYTIIGLVAFYYPNAEDCLGCLTP